ncbi:MAG: hypothetical protein ACPHK2_01285, partial [Candidatus Poseidoniaceae archaeon]
KSNDTGEIIGYGFYTAAQLSGPQAAATYQFEGSESGWRVVKEFAWEHQMPLKSEVRIAGKKLK